MTAIERAVAAVASLATLLDLGVALALGAIAVVSLAGVVDPVVGILATHDIAGGVTRALHAILITIIVVELLETVLVYAQTHRFRVQPILIAGITAMVRRILLAGVETTSALDMAVTVASILALAGAVVLVDRIDNRKPDGAA
jgi:uncharacterized membrane protein (DUF373 family)